MGSSLKTTIDWINCAKFMAILAVLLDHSFGTLYTSERLIWASRYSVSLFIIISGFLSYRSNRKHKFSYYETVIHSLKNIVLTYIIAVLIYQIVIYKSFDLVVFINSLIRFNLSGPFYYVLIYINLMLINKLLYNLISFNSKMAIVKDTIIGYFIILVAYITTNYSNVLNVYGGGELFGGTFLFLYYLGMMFEKYKIFEKTNLVKCLVSMNIGGTFYICCWNFACNNGLALDGLIKNFGGFNPPGITLMILSISMIFFCYGAFNLLDRIKQLSFVVRFLSWLGSHTLYIFLFHALWLIYFLRPYVVISNVYIKFIVYFVVMIAGSMFIEYVINCICKIYRNVYKSQIIQIRTNNSGRDCEFIN